MTAGRWAGLLAATTILAGCALTREDQLRHKADRVESMLVKERDTALSAPPDSPDRRAKLEHLTDLRTELSAANLGITAAKYLPEDKRDSAYDVIEQVYETIEWNIPLAPGERQKPMPKQFSGGKFEFK